MDDIGRFLYELSVVERVQPEPLCQRIDILTHHAHHAQRARLHLDGGACQVALDADRQAIARALRPVADVVDPALRPVPVQARGDRHALWAQLLGDLGWYSPDMASITRALTPGRGPLRYHRIERAGNCACITVTNGSDYWTYELDLDAGQLPAAVPVEIADHLAPPAGPSPHWGPTPPRQAWAWLRRILRRW